jgi:5'-methylthioinosine phosphorylase
MTMPHSDQSSIDLAVIGGSGLYNFDGLENATRHRVETPYGAASGY